MFEQSNANLILLRMGIVLNYIGGLLITPELIERSKKFLEPAAKKMSAHLEKLLNSTKQRLGDKTHIYVSVYLFIVYIIALLNIFYSTLPIRVALIVIAELIPLIITLKFSFAIFRQKFLPSVDNTLSYDEGSPLLVKIITESSRTGYILIYVAMMFVSLVITLLLLPIGYIFLSILVLYSLCLFLITVTIKFVLTVNSKIISALESGEKTRKMFFWLGIALLTLGASLDFIATF